jgi:tetratricopeptide (TPR) repeat protein
VGAVINTLEAVFEDVYVFSTYKTPTQRDTFVVVGCKSGCDLEPIRPHTTMLPDSAVRQLRERSGGMILTDDFAPVENLLAPVVRTQGGKVGDLYFAEARRAAEAGDPARALLEAEKAVGVHPIWPEAWNFIAQQRDELGDFEGALEALRAALKDNPAPATAHHNLAQAFYQASRFEEAADHWRGAIAEDGANVTHRYNLGLALAAQQKLPEAIAAWEEAVRIAPSHLSTLHNLALAYLMLARHEEAWKTVDQIRALGSEPEVELVQRLQQIAPRTPQTNGG